MENSATYAIFDLVRNLRARGTSVIDLGGGEPAFDTPRHITDEAVTALYGGFTHYTPSRGTPELLSAIAGKLEEENGVAVDPTRDIVVTPSAKHALFISLLTVLDPGDELLVLTPGWVSYGAMARLAGARPVPVALSPADGFRITRERLESRVTGRTRALLVNTPNNPTGRALSSGEAAVIAAFARDHDLFIVTDEIYEKILYDGTRHLSLAALPGCAERTLTVNGFSKAYAMTGWRLGWVSGPGRLVGEALKALQHTVGCASAFVQRGGATALLGPQDAVGRMTAEYASRRKLIIDGLNALPGIVCAPPEGTFYAFADIVGTGAADSATYAEWLLREAGVAVTPGSAFGAGGEGHVRLSFAASREDIEEALERMGSAMARWG
ncbi:MULTISPECIES: pyridoxal phosphate-dependent aminotransferase [Streptomyces]|uniref:pyridoxal phosphate-dependent aminotransferase n=1 Tax=Streptomyces lycopersici TaxID=2974589 RepID=UPI0021CFB0A5|nr:pyridoxal phosphate-dependent aminotransferase [Streptomyces sp. NEAU-383]